MENFPQGLLPPTSQPVASLIALSTISEPRSQHGVVVHTWTWYLPIGLLKMVKDFMFLVQQKQILITFSYITFYIISGQPDTTKIEM